MVVGESFYVVVVVKSVVGVVLGIVLVVIFLDCGIFWVLVFLIVVNWGWGCCRW